MQLLCFSQHCLCLGGGPAAAVPPTDSTQRLSSQAPLLAAPHMMMTTGAFCSWRRTYINGCHKLAIRIIICKRYAFWENLMIILCCCQTNNKKILQNLPHSSPVKAFPASYFSYSEQSCSEPSQGGCSTMISGTFPAKTSQYKLAKNPLLRASTCKSAGPDNTGGQVTAGSQQGRAAEPPLVHLRNTVFQ